VGSGHQAQACAFQAQKPAGNASPGPLPVPDPRRALKCLIEQQRFKFLLTAHTARSPLMNSASFATSSRSNVIPNAVKAQLQVARAPRNRDRRTQLMVPRTAGAISL